MTREVKRSIYVCEVPTLCTGCGASVFNNNVRRVDNPDGSYALYCPKCYGQHVLGGSE